MGLAIFICKFYKSRGWFSSYRFLSLINTLSTNPYCWNDVRKGEISNDNSKIAHNQTTLTHNQLQHNHSNNKWPPYAQWQHRWRHSTEYIQIIITNAQLIIPKFMVSHVKKVFELILNEWMKETTRFVFKTQLKEN